MTTVILGPRPPEVEALIEQRRQLGQDRHDEVWEGVYHVAASVHSRHARLESEMQHVLRPLVKAKGLTLTTGFNLGTDNSSFRVPDFGIFIEPPDALYVPTAEIVGEVLSPDDESVFFEKIPYYRERGVWELFMVHPADRAISVYHLQGYDVRVTEHSTALGVTAAALAAQVDWP